MSNAPLHRHEDLRDLSRDHHDGLLLCWKIREGLKKGIDPQRIMAYAAYTFREALLPHFQLEERFMLPVLPVGHPGRVRALSDHRLLTDLFNRKSAQKNTLMLIGQKLSEHIRFEERELFAEIQQMTTADQLHTIAAMHRGRHEDTWEDRFWEKTQK